MNNIPVRLDFWTNVRKAFCFSNFFFWCWYTPPPPPFSVSVVDGGVSGFVFLCTSGVTDSGFGGSTDVPGNRLLVASTALSVYMWRLRCLPVHYCWNQQLYGCVWGVDGDIDVTVGVDSDTDVTVGRRHRNRCNGRFRCNCWRRRRFRCNCWRRRRCRRNCRHRQHSRCSSCGQRRYQCSGWRRRPCRRICWHR